MLPLNTTIKDTQTWTAYITEESGGEIPAGLESAVNYMQLLTAIFDTVDHKTFLHDINVLRDWLIERGYYELPKKRSSTKTKRTSSRPGMGNGNDNERHGNRRNSGKGKKEKESL